MDNNRILVAVDASLASRYAAEAAWKIGLSTGCVVEGVCIINPDTVWDFLGGRQPGIVSFDTYFPAYERIVDQLVRLADTVAENFQTGAESLGVKSTFSVIVGDPLEKLSRLSSSVAMVVTGHTVRQEQEELRQSSFLKLSMAEQLALQCSAPLLVVQKSPADWKSSTIFVAADHINETYLTEALSFSRQVLLDPEILCLATGINEEAWDDMVKDLRKANPALQDVAIAVAPAQPDRLWANSSYWSIPTEHPIHMEESTVLTIPTRRIEDRCITMFGNSAAMWVHNVSAPPAILLFPEEFTTKINDMDLSLQVEGR